MVISEYKYSKTSRHLGLRFGLTSLSLPRSLHHNGAPVYFVLFLGFSFSFFVFFCLFGVISGKIFLTILLTGLLVIQAANVRKLL
jgi:hypothetical protein